MLKIYLNNSKSNKENAWELNVCMDRLIDRHTASHHNHNVSDDKDYKTGLTKM